MGDQAMMVSRPRTPAAPSRAPTAARFTPVPAGLVQRCGGVSCPPGSCDHEDRAPLQRFSSAPAPDKVPAIVEEVLHSPGRPMDAETRAFMEPRFGHDFGAIRVHHDPRAAGSAAAVAARAYTVGRHVVMGAGYQPGTAAGQRLLAHELTHALQQGQSAQGPPQRLAVGPPGSPAELEADRAADSVVGSAGAPTQGERVAGGTLSRQPQAPSLSLGRTQTTKADFHDPNLCYRIPLRDAWHPDRTKVVAEMQAQILTPGTCDGKVILRTSVLKSAWGAASAQFESYGGGDAQGFSENVVRDDAGERVDYEEQFTLDGCQASFARCHLITYYEEGKRYVFAEAFYQPMIGPKPGQVGTQLEDKTLAPELQVEPCDNVKPTRCAASTTAAPSKGKPAPKPGAKPGAKPKPGEKPKPGSEPKR